jgi:hypothetical protein
VIWGTTAGEIGRTGGVPLGDTPGDAVLDGAAPALGDAPDGEVLTVGETPDGTALTLGKAPEGAALALALAPVPGPPDDDVLDAAALGELPEVAAALGGGA